MELKCPVVSDIDLWVSIPPSGGSLTIETLSIRDFSASLGSLTGTPGLQAVGPMNGAFPNS